MAHPEDERRALGVRLAAARRQAGYTSAESAAKELTKLGYPVGKAGVGAWETGRNLPDVFWLRRLAKLYKTTMDALVWDDSLSPEVVKLASALDSLTGAGKAWAMGVCWSAINTTKENQPPFVSSDEEEPREDSARFG